MVNAAKTLAKVMHKAKREQLTARNFVLSILHSCVAVKNTLMHRCWCMYIRQSSSTTTIYTHTHTLNWKRCIRPSSRCSFWLVIWKRSCEVKNTWCWLTNPVGNPPKLWTRSPLPSSLDTRWFCVPVWVMWQAAPHRAYWSAWPRTRSACGPSCGSREGRWRCLLHLSFSAGFCVEFGHIAALLLSQHLLFELLQQQTS